MSTVLNIQRLFATATLSFQPHGHSGQGPDGQSQNSQSCNSIFPTHGQTYDFLTRACAFGAIVSEIESVTNIHVGSVQYPDVDAPMEQGRVFDCAIIEMNIPAEDMDGNVEPKFIHIYKDTSTGLYTIGHLIDEVLYIEKTVPDDLDNRKEFADQLADNQLYFEVFKRMRDAAHAFRCLQIPLINTMDSKKALPGLSDSLPARVGRAFVIELSNYIHRTFC